MCRFVRGFSPWLVAAGLVAVPGAAQQQRTPARPSPARPAPAFGRGVTTPKRPPGTYVSLKTTMGEIVLRMLPASAPHTVANFLGLAGGTRSSTDPKTGTMARRPFYDSLTFHRVLPGFMIQAGCPKGDGTGGPGYTIPDERPAARPYLRGAVLMSHRGRPNSAGSQFMILQADVRGHLPPTYVVFAEVAHGMSVVDRIASAPVLENPHRRSERSSPIRTVAIERAAVTQVRG